MPPKKKKKVPERMCIGCREYKNKRELIRVARTAEGNVEIDSSGKLPGRGAYMCPQEDCLTKAVKNRGLEKSLRRSIPENVIEDLKSKLQDV